MVRTPLAVLIALAVAPALALAQQRPAKPAAKPAAAAPVKPAATTPARPSTEVPLPPPPAAAAPRPAAAAPAQPPRKGKAKIAVLDLVPVQGVATGTASILTSIVVDDVGQSGLDTVATREIAAMLGFEKQRQMLGCSEDAACMAEIGGALGVDYILSGQVGQIGSQYHVSLQIIDTRKAKAVARGSQFAEKKEDALIVATRAAVASALATLGGAGPSGPAQMAKRDRTGAWIALGTGAGLLVAGGVTGAIAQSRWSDLEGKRGEPGFAEEWNDKASGIRNLAVAADVMMVGGAISAGIGTWLWLRADSPVAVVPYVPGPDGAGLVLAGTF